jgi:hypothetical protein
MTYFVDQFDAVDAARPARGAADFMHEFEQHTCIHIPSGAQSWINPEMQDRESLMRRAHENGNPQRTAFIGDGEQGLNSLDVADAYAQAAVLRVDFGHSIGVDGLLNAHPYSVLIYVEKQQLLQGGTLLNGQFRGDTD